MTDLSIVEFLAFYGLLCAGVLAFAHVFVARADDSTISGHEPLPSTFDPFEIAYLRGDTNELVRYAVFDLTHHGLLELAPEEPKKERLVRRTAAAPNPSAIHPVCAAVYGFFDRPRTSEELFKSGVPATAAAAFATQRRRLDERRLLAPQAARDASRIARLVGIVAILVPAAYRVWYALAMHHRNILFTIGIAIVSAIALFPLTGVRRLSRRGKRYVDGLRASLTGGGSAPALESPAFAVMVAAGGLTMLEATPYAGLNRTFRQRATPNSWSSSCSGACGGVVDGGSGDGGGSSGGDGGGGCGGGCGG